MTAPNIAKVKKISSKNATVVAGTTATTVVSNASNSYKVLKINQIAAGNNSAVFAKLTIDIYRGSTASRFLPGIQIPPVSILEAISKPIYLEEGDSLRVTCDVANAVEVSVSYEEMQQQFTPTSVESLVVAGGGGGGTVTSAGNGGGGGAGGFLSESVAVSTGVAYQVTVGIGGSPSAKGNDSVFSAYTAIGGGYGGGIALSTGGSGGSGGGAYSNNGNTYSGGSGTSGQGFNGGASTGFGSRGGGGGGAGGTGANGSTNGGTGGVGLQSSITGTATYYAGGGGGGGVAGGVGGSNIGGTGSNGTTSATAGAANTGSGGGGGRGASAVTGAEGGSGVVIIAYPQGLNDIASITGTLVYTKDTVSRPGYKVYKFTSGTGTISW